MLKTPENAISIKYHINHSTDRHSPSGTVEPILKDHGTQKCLPRQVVSGDRLSYAEM